MLLVLLLLLLLLLLLPSFQLLPVLSWQQADVVHCHGLQAKMPRLQQSSGSHDVHGCLL
jgi:hypothetical protein